jgi:spermidine synthase
MGATFPLMMAYVREWEPHNTESFSYLYLANVLGAMGGTLLTAVVFIEVFGFRDTLALAAAGNFSIAAVAGWLWWSRKNSLTTPSPAVAPAGEKPAASDSQFPRRGFVRLILFSTGFCAMAMEVVWARAFAPVLKTQVYSFAAVVFVYLGATFFGSLWYRRHLRTAAVRPMVELLALLAIAAFLPVLVNDARLVTAKWNESVVHLPSAVLLLASICPFCAVLGYLTPRLIDQSGAGDPANAGKAYALNVFGCILGPLLASYILLPWLRERHALILLSLPFILFFLLGGPPPKKWQRTGFSVVLASVLVFALFATEDFEVFVAKQAPRSEVRRDYAASVISAGDGMDKGLLVNGISMTSLTPITKFMVHLPLAFHKGQSGSVLIICFGMGTTYRSALSWDVRTTAVELVPSVKQAFGYYHTDAAKVAANPKGTVIIDDGRRFLRRTREKFDVIVIDPPPPVAAAGSSLLYSKQFYELARQHLNPGGILQAWFPGGELKTGQAVVRSINDSFPYVRCFDSIEGWGTHLLASMDPIESHTAAELAARLPPGARQDLLEWTPIRDLPAYLNGVLSHEVMIQDVMDSDPRIQIDDDHPFNEYFLLRQYRLYSY